MLVGGGGGQRRCGEGKAGNQALIFCSNWYQNRVGHVTPGGVSFYEARIKRRGNLICEARGIAL